MTLAFVHNFASHYTSRTFELLAERFDIDFFFFGGNERYWMKEHGVKSGKFKHEYLTGFQLGGTNITPQLVSRLWSRNYDLYVSSIDGRFALPISYLVARSRRKPFILWSGIWHRLGTRFHRLAFGLVKYVYTHADAIIVYGEHVKSYLISEGVDPDRVFVAAHAVDNDVLGMHIDNAQKLALRDELGVSSEKKIVLYLGRLEEAKGLEYLIQAFSSLKEDAVLVLAGTGAFEQSLKKLVEEKGIGDRVRFPGYVPQHIAPIYYASATVFVLPSITTPTFKEPWGLVVNEAFNQGLPVIATDAVGAAAGGLVQDGRSGFVVPERNVDALATSLLRILGDPALREELSAGARQIISGWDKQNMIAGFQRAIAQVTKGVQFDKN